MSLSSESDHQTSSSSATTAMAATRSAIRRRDGFYSSDGFYGSRAFVGTHRHTSGPSSSRHQPTHTELHGCRVGPRTVTHLYNMRYISMALHYCRGSKHKS